MNFLYKSLHATYLVILLSSADFFQNKYFQEISGKKSRCQIVWIQIRTKHTYGPDLTPNCSWMLSADDKSLMISCFQKRDISRFSRTKVNLIFMQVHLLKHSNPICLDKHPFLFYSACWKLFRYFVICCLFLINLLYSSFIITIRESKSLDSDQVWHFVGADLVQKLFAKVISRQQL